MSLDVLIAPLLRVPVFAGLDIRRLSRIAMIADRLVLKHGDELIREDAEGDAAYLVIAGEVQVSYLDGADPLVFGPGTLIGELAMLTETVHASTVSAYGPLKVMRLARDQMLELMAGDADLADHFVAKMRERLAEMADRLRDVDDFLVDSMEADASQDWDGEPYPADDAGDYARETIAYFGADAGHPIEPQRYS